MINSVVTINKEKKAFRSIASELMPGFLVISPPRPVLMGSTVWEIGKVLHEWLSGKQESWKNILNTELGRWAAQFFRWLFSVQITTIPPGEVEWAGRVPGRVVKSEAVRRENKYVTFSKEEESNKEQSTTGWRQIVQDQTWDWGGFLRAPAVTYRDLCVILRHDLSPWQWTSAHLFEAAIFTTEHFWSLASSEY